MYLLSRLSKEGSNKFKDLMGTNAQKGKIYDPPKGTESFIEQLEVVKVEVKEENNGFTRNPGKRKKRRKKT